MKLRRRRFLRLAAGAAIPAVLPAIFRSAKAQTYPTRPVRIIVGFAAGGPTDILARLIGQWLSERLGQSFVVEDRPGAATNIATEEVTHAPPDGYTLLAAVSTNTINPVVLSGSQFQFHTRHRDDRRVDAFGRSARSQSSSPDQVGP
jgi:tripartite-type tricarboxylate transporter receptor subunit TctC